MSKTTVLDRRSYEDGKAIFKQGDNGDAAFVVELGEVAIIKEIEGETVRLGTIKQGGIFGEMSVIDDTPRMATAIAVGHVILVRVPKAVFAQKLTGCDPFIRGLITIFLNNIRSAHKLYSKRPRSLMDHMRLLEAFSLDLTTYINTVDVSDFSPDMAGALDDLNDALSRVRSAAGPHRDRRESVVTPDDAKGISLRTILDKG